MKIDFLEMFEKSNRSLMEEPDLMNRTFSLPVKGSYNGFTHVVFDKSESTAYLGTTNGKIEVVDLINRKAKGNLICAQKPFFLYKS